MRFPSIWEEYFPYVLYLLILVKKIVGHRKRGGGHVPGVPHLDPHLTWSAKHSLSHYKKNRGRHYNSLKDLLFVWWMLLSLCFWLSHSFDDTDRFDQFIKFIKVLLTSINYGAAFQLRDWQNIFQRPVHMCGLKHCLVLVMVTGELESQLNSTSWMD